MHGVAAHCGPPLRVQSFAELAAVDVAVVAAEAASRLGRIPQLLQHDPASEHHMTHVLHVPNGLNSSVEGATSEVQSAECEANDGGWHWLIQAAVDPERPVRVCLAEQDCVDRWCRSKKRLLADGVAAAVHVADADGEYHAGGSGCPIDHQAESS